MDRWETLATMKCRSEAEVESRIVLPLLSLLGWHPQEIHQAVPVEFPVGRKTGRKPEADVVLAPPEPTLPTIAYVVVEAKKPGEPLDDATEQAWSYAFAFGSPLFVLTNGDAFQIWVTGPVASICEKVFACRVSELAEKQQHLERTLRRDKAIARHEQMMADQVRRTNDIITELSSISSYTLDGLAQHQREAIEAVRMSLRNHEPYTSVYLPPGTGKTATILALCAMLLESQSFKRILYVVDRSILLKQVRGHLRHSALGFPSIQDLFDVGVVGDGDLRHARLVLGTEQILRRRRPSSLDDRFDLVLLDDWYRGDSLRCAPNEEPPEHFAWLRSWLAHNAQFVAFSTKTRGPGAPFAAPVYTYTLPAAIADGWVRDFQFVQLPSSFRESVLCAREYGADILQVTDELVERLRTVSFRRAAVFCRRVSVVDHLSHGLVQSLTSAFGTQHGGAPKVTSREYDGPEVLQRVEFEHRPVVVVGGQLLARSSIFVDCIVILCRVQSFSELEQMIRVGLRRPNVETTNATTIFFAQGSIDERTISMIYTRWGKRPRLRSG